MERAGELWEEAELRAEMQPDPREGVLAHGAPCLLQRASLGVRTGASKWPAAWPWEKAAASLCNGL